MKLLLALSLCLSLCAADQPEVVVSRVQSRIHQFLPVTSGVAPTDMIQIVVRPSSPAVVRVHVVATVVDSDGVVYRMDSKQAASPNPMWVMPVKDATRSRVTYVVKELGEVELSSMAASDLP
jgi:hypothetical protein